jgi:hypothetical protein
MNDISEFVSNITLNNILLDLESECMCGAVLGSHCGSRRNDGYLSINCYGNHLYRCPGANLTAEDRFSCKNCIEAEIPGSDYCLI